MSSPSIPDSWICPITQELMVDPVIAPDGHTYERSAITMWLQNNPISPMTRQPISSPDRDLIPNIALRQTIESYRAQRDVIGFEGSPSDHGAGKMNAEKKQDTTADTLQRQIPLGLRVSAVPIQQDGNTAQDSSSSSSSSSILVNVAVVPPTDGERLPARVICIIDTSYSMSEPATMGQENSESSMFSRLDLVKHSVSTVIGVLGPQDQIALVSFSTSAHVVMGLRNMDDTGKAFARTCLNSLQPNGMTNIWDGLRQGLGIHSSARNAMGQADGISPHNTVLLLFTDGEPNCNPPRGIIKTLEQQLAKAPMDFTIHAFGYGYNLDSKLLNDIAALGKGIFGYIPDSSMVGTVFVNFVSTALAAVSSTVRLSIAARGHGQIRKMVGYGEQADDADSIRELCIDIGMTQFGQTRNVVLVMDRPQTSEDSSGPMLEVALHADESYVTCDPPAQLHAAAVSNSEDESVVKDVHFQYARLLAISELSRARKEAAPRSKQGLRQAQQIVRDLYDVLKSLPQSDSLGCLLRDIQSDNDQEGQVWKAFSRSDWFARWGVHYLYSLLRSHLLQQCSNFKDPGVQGYGGALFRSLQATADDIFCNMPPPKPSIQHHSHSRAAGQTYRMPTNMRDFYNSSGVCLHEDNAVSMADGSVKKVGEIKAGDHVQCGTGDAVARVVCVVRFAIVAPTELVRLNKTGLLITPWHPVRSKDGVWSFPAHLDHDVVTIDSGYVYNFVLDREHVMVVQGEQCVTLGHGFEDDVVRHAFFGTQRVIESLQAAAPAGWTDGLVTFRNLQAKRDPQTGLVCWWTDGVGVGDDGDNDDCSDSLP